MTDSDDIGELKINLDVVLERNDDSALPTNDAIKMRFEHLVDITIKYHKQNDLETDADGLTQLEHHVSKTLREQFDKIDTRAIARKILGGRS